MLKAGDRIGDWIVIDVLGEGGMGAVYRCRNAMSDRIEAAVKVIKPHSLKDETERFVREVESLDALRHAAVVRIKGWGEDLQRGVLWLAMDIVRGDDLEKVLARGPLDVATARRVFASVADALRHAHQRGVYHRDIKPANIILGDDGHPWIVDFGIAVQKGRTRLTAMGTVPGTPAYMAPEIFSGESRPDPVKLDVYALGQVLHEAITGRFAFPDASDSISTGQALVSLMGRKLKAEALDPGPEFPDDLRALIRNATEPEPDDRLADMNSFYEALAVLPPVPRPSAPPIPVDGPVRQGKPTEWVQSNPPPAKAKPAASSAPKGAAPPPRSPPPHTTEPPRRGGLGVGLLVAFGLMIAALFVLIGLSAVAVIGGMGWSSRGGTDTGVVVVEAAPRDLQVAITGLTAGTPVELAVDGRRPDNLSSTTFEFAAVPVGVHEISVVVGEGCVLEDVAECPGCCTCLTHVIEVVAGEGEQTVAIEAAPPPPPSPRSVRVRAPQVEEPWNVLVDLGGATGPTGSRVDRVTKDYPRVEPGTYAMRVEAGRCPTDARGCWPTGACPDGCVSYTTQVSIPCGEEVHEIVVDLPTPKGTAPVAAASGTACRKTCPSGAWTGGNIAAGERVSVTAVHEDDAYCGYPGVVGVTGTVAGGMQSNDGCWMGGGLYGDDGVEYYFYKASVKKVGSSAPRPAPTATGKDGRYLGASIPRGARVLILDVHPDDAYYSYRDSLVALGCEATGELTAMDSGWFAGPLHCAAAEVDLYFYKVALKR